MQKVKFIEARKTCKAPMPFFSSESRKEQKAFNSRNAIQIENMVFFVWSRVTSFGRQYTICRLDLESGEVVCCSPMDYASRRSAWGEFNRQLKALNIQPA